MAPIIEVCGVSKAFRIPTERRDTLREHVLGLFEPRQFQKLQVLDDISFEIQPGEALGIMGRNGCGKSTLLKIICGIFPPDSGRVITRAPITPILELGVGWNPELDAVDNVCLVGSVMGLTLVELRKRMSEILDFAELEKFAHLKLKHYSSGMAARLAYSVVFAAVRDVLVLDEIFAVGDAGFRAKCYKKFRELHASGHTMLLVSHDSTDVSRYCDHALRIDGGRIVQVDQPAAVAKSYVQSVTGPG
jgi:ABC-type polysaccharide/polyol phosphate transport system ATPase subunit